MNNGVRIVGADHWDIQFCVQSDTDPKCEYTVWVSRRDKWRGCVGCTCMHSQTRLAKNRPTLLEGHCKHVAKVNRWAEEMNDE